MSIGGENENYEKTRRHLDKLFSHPERPITFGVKGKPKEFKAPEFVQHVTSSSAGAGSGEFHLYRNARRKEYERLKQMEEDLQKETLSKMFGEKTTYHQQQDDQRTTKNRLKRLKHKETFRNKRQKEVDQQKEGISEVVEPPHSIPFEVKEKDDDKGNDSEIHHSQHRKE